MLLVARCRAAGVTMLGRHATETRAGAHSMALLVIALGEREFGGPRGGGPWVDDGVPGLTTAN